MEKLYWVVMVLMTVCRERVDWYGVGFWGEHVADPFICSPVASYSTLYRGIPFLISP